MLIHLSLLPDVRTTGGRPSEHVHVVKERKERDRRRDEGRNQVVMVEEGERYTNKRSWRRRFFSSTRSSVCGAAVV